jgi:hypothetical protein
MEVTVDAAVDLGDFEPLRQALERRIAELGLAREAREIDLDAWLRAAAEGRSRIEGALLFAGLRPVLPRDGVIEWGGEFFKEGFVVDPKTGAVDYRRRAARREVQEGQLLARVIPPVPGENGRNVFGKVVKVRPARAADISAGEKVREDEEGRFIATASGRVLYEHGSLSVTDVLKIDGDVGLKTGHITHHGAIVVSRDILEGSLVVADGDIEVHGVIEPCGIKAGGSLIVNGGVAGKGGQPLEVAGNVHARFLLDVDLSAGGEVVVEREVLHSRIVARGVVAVPEGRIVGGHVASHEQVLAREIGTEADVATVVEVIDERDLAGTLEKTKATLESTRKTRAEITAVTDPLGAHEASLPEAKRRILQRLRAKADALQEEMAALEASIAELETELEARPPRHVLVDGCLRRGTRIVIGGVSRTVFESVGGPLRVVRRGDRLELEAVEETVAQAQA